jgi:hypothetical protein
MATKARRLIAASEYAGAVDSEIPISATQAGETLRHLLEVKVLSGAITSKDLAILAHHITLSRGQGLEDLAVDPKHADKHGSEHVELILAQKYPRPNLKTIQIPANAKKGAVRESMSCAIRLPSTILSEIYLDANHIEPPGDDPSVLPLFADHPVVRRGQQLGMHWSRLLPIVLYTDGVKYSTRDSFIVFFFRYRL